jgi:hypothetical protein
MSGSCAEEDGSRSFHDDATGTLWLSSASVAMKIPAGSGAAR